MNTPADIRTAIERFHAKNEPFFGGASRAERLRSHPFLVPFVALSRRMLGFFINTLRILPEFFEATTFFGGRMLVHMPEGFMIWWYGFLEGWELPLTAVIAERVKPGDAFFDVGANDGYFTLFGAALVGPSGRVYSFEPSPSAYARLRPYVAPHTNVTFENLALLDREGEIPFSDFGSSVPGSSSAMPMDELLRARPELAGRGGTTISVRATTLDTYLAERQGVRPAFLQMDTEGMEYDILLGARQTLAAHKPVIAIEVFPAALASGKYAKTVEYLRQFGYVPHDLTSRGALAPAGPVPLSGTVVFV